MDGSTSARARHGADLARQRARRGAEVARERMEEVAEQVEPQARRRAAAASRAGRTALAAASTLPGIVSRVLALLATLLGGLAERGREAAARVDPPRAERRRSRWRTAGWFLGGFGAGAAAGWVLHARLQEPVQGADGGVTAPPPYGDEAAAIDARRADVPSH